jgi:hypothetical protein
MASGPRRHLSCVIVASPDIECAGERAFHVVRGTLIHGINIPRHSTHLLVYVLAPRITVTMRSRHVR